MADGIMEIDDGNFETEVLQADKPVIEVVLFDPEKNLVYVRGGVPGHNDAVMRLRAAVGTGASK